MFVVCMGFEVGVVVVDAVWGVALSARVDVCLCAKGGG